MFCIKRPGIVTRSIDPDRRLVLVNDDRVALRVRPLTVNEQLHNASEIISFVPNEPQIGIVGSDKSFTFDYVFDEETKQRQVYEQCAKDLVERFVEG